MIIMGIDAAHRATGVVVAKVQPNSTKIERVLLHTTLKTKKIQGTVEEYLQLLQMINRLKKIKSETKAWLSVCEIAHSGQNFASARNVGITWSICAATDSIPYTSSMVRKAFGANRKRNAKDQAFEWVAAHNWTLIKTLKQMDHHQIDALACLLTHNTK